MGASAQGYDLVVAGDDPEPGVVAGGGTAPDRAVFPAMGQPLVRGALPAHRSRSSRSSSTTTRSDTLTPVLVCPLPLFTHRREDGPL